MTQVRSELAKLAEQIKQTAADAAVGEGSGRGIVVAAGGARMFTNAYVLLHVLRHTLNCRLSVEIWYLGQSEISPAMSALLEPFDARLVDAEPLVRASGSVIRDGWQLKSLALVHSGFAEVLLLDADQVPVSDPAAIFDWPPYRETGAVFWPDIVDLRTDNEIWQVLGLPPRRSVSLESGQILVDRRRHAAALLAALRLNEAADLVYQLIYGDKDTYLLAWEMTGSPCAIVPHRPFRDDFVIVQRDFDGDALFQHRTNAKWQHGGEQRRIHGFVHEADCLAALSQLEHDWSGRAFTAPDRSARARGEEEILAAAGDFVLHCAGEPPVTLRFGRYAELSEGRAADRLHWWIEDEEGRLHLILTGGDRRSYRLTKGLDGIWTGRRMRHPAVVAHLVPAGGGEAMLRQEGPGLVDDLLRAGGGFARGDAHVPPLRDAIRLFAAISPGVAERLERLSTLQSDPRIAARLAQLAEDVRAGEMTQAVDRSLKIEDGYVRAEIGE